MNYPDASYFFDIYRTNYQLISMQTDGITNAESLLQLPFRGNCMNWVVGHLVRERDFVLTLLDQPKVWGDAEYLFYRRDSSPITPASQAVPFEQILQALALSQKRILEGLEKVTPAQWQKQTCVDNQEGAVGELVAGFHWHETYHCGQLEILRQLAGKNDKVV